MKAKKLKIVAFSVAGVLLALLIVLSAVVGAFSDMLDKWVVGYKGGGSDSAARAAGRALAEQIHEEGTVLAQNTDNLLPLKKADNDKVNVFGWAATDWVLSGSGSGQVKRANSVDLLGALEEYGIEYNTELTDMYEKYRANREFSVNGGNTTPSSATTGNELNNNWGSLHSFNYEFSRLYEPSINDPTYYPSDLLQRAKEYSETAFVVIGRVSGESNDSPEVQYKGEAGSNKRTGKPTTNVDEDRTYLEISTEEEELLQYVGSEYKNVVVIINSTNVMELGFMKTIPGLDACIIAATTGSVGAKALPRIIYSDIIDEETGENISVSPSGKTADTYAYDLTTAATYVDVGKGNDTTHFYSNSNDTYDGNKLYPMNVSHTNGSSNEAYRGVAYEDYRESIYVGYKWYETADTEGFWDSDWAKTKWGISKGYEDVVQYPFGFGLSYTTFSWEVKGLEKGKEDYVSSGDTVDKDTNIKMTVRVTNTGNYAGQDVVQLYYNPPYKSTSQIEKSSVNLLAFAKTQNILNPGDFEDVELEFTVSDMASYDYLGNVVPGGGYVLEDGNYEITLRTDAHTLAGTKLIGNEFLRNDTLTLKINGNTRCLEEAQNRFTGENTTDGVAIDGNSDGSAEITYLTRSNFKDTFPAEKGDNRAMTDKIKALNLYKESDANAWDSAWAEANPDTNVTFAANNNKLSTPIVEQKTEDNVTYLAVTEFGLRLGLNYDDPDWETLLNEIPKSEMQSLVLHGYTKTMAVSSIGKPETLDYDGPNQVGSFDGNADYASMTGFSSIVLAQTWNAQLAYSMGLTIGAEAAESSITGWYGPGVNVHRSPFGGRNYEYYSEDALLSGIMCAKVVSAAKNRGVFSYLKHICLYESESGRDGMYTWVTEQALREIYLRPFEIAVKKGGSSAIMTSYGRIGAVWTGGSEALLTEVVRGEWGFKGAFLTDYADHHDFMNGDQMLRAGGDLWMDGWAQSGPGPGSFKYSTDSDAYNYALRNATKHVVYMWLNALATNQDYNAKIESGEIIDSIVIPTAPELNFRWYIPVLIVVDVLLAAVAAWMIVSGIKGYWLFFGKKNGSVKEAVAEGSEVPAEEPVANDAPATEEPETPSDEK